MPTRIIVPIVIAALTALFIWWQAPSSSQIEQQASASMPAARSTLTSGADDSMQFVTGMENLPASLAGTDIDGGFELDEQGNLLPSLRTRELFDYFLATQGEEPLEQIIARLHAYIGHHLSAPANQQALALLDDYLGYLRVLADIPAPAVRPEQMDAATLRAHHDAVGAMRDQYFDTATREAFFGEEAALDRYTVARLALLEDDSLSTSEQAKRLALLQQQLPEAVRQPLEQLTRIEDLRAMTDKLQSENGSAAELREVRESLLGSEAADRLETLDAERIAWQQRMDAWLTERQHLLSQDSLSDADREALIDRARAERFSEQEIVRVRALERISG